MSAPFSQNRLSEITTVSGTECTIQQCTLLILMRL